MLRANRKRSARLSCRALTWPKPSSTPSAARMRLAATMSSTSSPFAAPADAALASGIAAPMLLVPAVAQHMAGKRAGVPALLEQHFAVDDRGEDALGRLLDAPGALREIADDDLVPAIHGGRVEDHDVAGE